MQIINRFSGNVIAEGDMNLRELVLHVVKTARDNNRGADLRGADLQGAYLRGTDLQDAYLRGLKIRSCAVFTGLYRYIAMPIIAEDGKEYIRMGCYFQSVDDWAKNFWNNYSEFPNDGDMASKLRWMAYQTCLSWLELNRETAEREDC